MAEGLVISIDGMGGDHAPESVLDGIEIAARKDQRARFIVHGPETVLASLIAARPAARAVCDLRHADKVVSMDVKPSQAMRQGKGSSMWNALASVEEGEAQVCVSAGNTGALMAIAMLRLRKMDGVHRPALVASWPTARGFAAVLDVGANVEADASQLVEFAIMGEAFQRAVRGDPRPRVGLLNVGAEDQKGHEEIRAAGRLIREANIDLDFHGFIEGDDISKGTVDVVVTDGFTGNIALKTAEGTARLVAGFLREALSGSILSRAGALLAYPALKQLKDRMDPRSVNGAVFVGLNGLVVKSHGGADGLGYASAIDVAIRMAGSHFREEVVANLARLAVTDVAPAAATGTS
ncbi:MAG: phosphate acyltransferase PlsX [Hyphomonadaceae bacterium]|nr:phosphate acyltransferase PlsX [Hyphomonadaceae bacterium]